MLNKSCIGQYGRIKGNVTTEAFTLIARGNTTVRSEFGKTDINKWGGGEPKHFLNEQF